jgi:hypothetical protein
MDMSYTQDVYMSHGIEYNRHAQHCNVVALYIDGCLGFRGILVYWNESTLYNFRRVAMYNNAKRTLRKLKLFISTVLQFPATRYARA